MGEYNKLTKMLLSQGYTAEYYPKDIVRIASGCFSRSGNPLENIYGGFKYASWYADSFTYRTGCGMYVHGSNVIPDMGYMSEEWCHENDNPVIRCPFDKPECPQNDPRLHGTIGGGLCIQCFCVCHRTDEEYVYEESYEYQEQLRRDEKNKKYQEFSDARDGRVCEQHMFYDERTREWSFRYNPKRCAVFCYSQNGYCPILGKELSTKKGNVYYDLKRSGVKQHKRPGEQTSIFDGESWTRIEKGIRYFPKPCSIDICKAFVKVQGKKKIQSDYEFSHSFDRLLYPETTVEVLNVRAEVRASRDIEQDLQDIRNGITVTHASDMEKEKKAKKKEKRQAAQQKRVARLEKRLISMGYENLEPHSLDKVHADKWLGSERIAELEAIRQENIRKEANMLVQGSILDLMSE